jgi:hypothetical protein
MASIPMSHRGKRPRFFPTAGMDEMVSMMVELTAEVWVLKKRLYLLEKVAADQGLDFTARIEAYAMEQSEVDELAAERKKMIANVLRALEAEFGAPADAPADTLEDPPQADGARNRSRAA